MEQSNIDTQAATETRAAFTIDPAAIDAAAAFLAKRVIERRNQTPIAAHILICADPAGAVTMTGTDFDHWARVTLPATVESPGAICLEAGPLADALAKLRKGKAWEVRLTVTDSTRATLTAGGCRGSFKLKALPADDFPLAPTVGEGEAAPLSAFTMPAGQALADFAALVPCMSTQEARYYLNGVAIQARDMAGRDCLNLMATDGSNLAMASRPIPAGAESLPDLILHRKAVAMLPGAVKVAGAVDALALSYDPAGASAGIIRLDLGPVTIWSKAIDGTFPDMGRPFVEQLAPTDGEAPALFPELVAGTPLAAMAKAEKAAGQPIEWQDAAKGKIGSVPNDPGLLFACMNGAAANEPVKGFTYGYSHDQARAIEYLTGQAVRHNGPIPADWDKRRLLMQNGEALGATFGRTSWEPGRYETVQDWERLVEVEFYIEPREVWADGSYSVVMPRERRELRADVTLEVDGDSTVYPIAQNRAGAIHLTADQVRRIAGEADTRVIQVRTRGGRTAHVYAAVWEAGALALEPCKASGAEIRKGFAVHSQIARADVVWTSADGDLAAPIAADAAPIAAEPEAVSVECPEICPPEAAESDCGDIPALDGGEALDALHGADLPPHEPVTVADELPAPAPAKESLTAEPLSDAQQLPDPVAELAARVAALEARLAALPAESAAPPSGEVARPKRTAAHERAIRRAWAARIEARRQRAIAADHMRMREQVQEALRASHSDLATAETVIRSMEARERALKADVERLTADCAEWEALQHRTWGDKVGERLKRRASAARARRFLASTRKAARFQEQRADVLAAQLAKIKHDMADPTQPERASDLARLVQERDQARTALAATDARNRAMKTALDDLADKFEAMASRLAVAEAAMRRAPIAV